MRAGMHAPVTDTGACCHYMAGMAASCDTMFVHARACANRSNMGTRTDPMFADMRADTDAKDINIDAHGIGRDGRKQGKSENRSYKRFHERHPWQSFSAETDCSGGSSGPGC
jgi:hypothetical protein